MTVYTYRQFRPEKAMLAFSQQGMIDKAIIIHKHMMRLIERPWRDQGGCNRQDQKYKAEQLTNIWGY